MARRFTRGSAVATRKRQTTWIGPADQDAVSVATGASTIIASFPPDDAGMLHPTLVRTRGECSIRPSDFSADLAISGAFGVCIVSDEAFVAGTASIPRPFDDANWGGWLMWQSFSRRLEFGSAVGFDVNAAWTWQIDSKAMRKIAQNEIMVLMCESQVGGLQCAMHLRFLFMLS